MARGSVHPGHRHRRELRPDPTDALRGVRQDENRSRGGATVRFMSEYDIDVALRRFDPGRTPNRAYLAAVVDALRDWANSNSDGWAYWPKPARAARRAFELIDGYTTPDRTAQEEYDATDAEVRAALAPIKALLTRQGVRHETVLPARQMAVTW